MRQTSNYHLPLWDAADRILREDFNRGNQKIDVSLANLRLELLGSIYNLQAALPFVKLAEVTTASAAQQVDISLAGMNLLQYRRIEIDALCPVAGKTLTLRLNNLRSYLSGSSLNSVSYIGRLLSTREEYPSGYLRLNPPFRNTPLACYFESATPWSAESSVNQIRDLRWENLTALNFFLEDGTSMPMGTKFRVYGVKV